MDTHFALKKTCTLSTNIYIYLYKYIQILEGKSRDRVCPNLIEIIEIIEIAFSQTKNEKIAKIFGSLNINPYICTQQIEEKARLLFF